MLDYLKLGVLFVYNWFKLSVDAKRGKAEKRFSRNTNDNNDNSTVNSLLTDTSIRLTSL